MKVGVDAVLLGAWVSSGGERVLDVGTGCGVISLILAQRFPDTKIDAIDIDRPSVEEASLNFKNSPWELRLNCYGREFPKDLSVESHSYDLVVSNPPFFNSGIKTPATPREKARHQEHLSIFSLIEYSPGILKEGGRLAMIYPLEFHEGALKKAGEKGFDLIRECKVRGNKNRPFKRVISEFSRGDLAQNHRIEREELILFEGDEPTEEYRSLCKDFYLKF